MERKNLQLLAAAIAGRHVSLGFLSESRNVMSVMTSQLLRYMHNNNLIWDSCSALHVDRGVYDLAQLKNMSKVTDLILSCEMDQGAAPPLPDESGALPKSVPWNRLLRLCIHDTHLIQAMRPFNLPLPSLRSLRLRPEQWCSENNRILYHTGCEITTTPYQTIHTDMFSVDFSCLPSLTDLEIQGMCNHVPVEHFVTENLRRLRIHTPHSHASTLPALSQRSSTDIALITKLAPHISLLEIDIGNIDNLWHSMSVPGVDIDMDIYRILAALSQLRSLHTLRLFPPYVTKATCRGIVTHPDVYLWPQMSSLDFQEQQPVTDADAVGMFERLRAQITTLQHFAILPARHFFCSNAREMGLESARPAIRMAVSMKEAWFLSRSGDRTILVTEREGNLSVAQRQVWVGQRRLTTETIHRKYFISINGYAGGSRLDDAHDEWLLE
jgi:hypothetical protein